MLGFEVSLGFRLFAPLMGALLMVACAATPQATLEDRTLPYGCNDTVVVGSVQNGAFELVPSKDDILGHGWISATLHVRKIVRGPRVPSVLPVKYFAHTYMRQDREFMLILQRTPSGYEITTGQLMSVHPLVASQCG